MVIKYPVLIEQAYRKAIKNGYKGSKADMYKLLVKNGIITETGEPTTQAIDTGLVYKVPYLNKTLRTNNGGNN